jgi:hypothetical protein
MTELAQDPVDGDTEDLAQQVADAAASFLLALRAIADDEAGSGAVPLLLLEVSQVLLAGARLAVQRDVDLDEEFEPEPGPDPDVDALRMRLADVLDGVDGYHEVFDPYGRGGDVDVVPSAISDDLASTASALAHGLAHHRAGRVREALWWWQFSYVASWGAEASAALRALQSVVAHDRLDADLVGEPARVAAAEAALGSAPS